MFSYMGWVGCAINQLALPSGWAPAAGAPVIKSASGQDAGITLVNQQQRAMVIICKGTQLKEEW
jgi:hypothetical protein